jgi:hypothetical protein
MKCIRAIVNWFEPVLKELLVQVQQNHAVLFTVQFGPLRNTLSSCLPSNHEMKEAVHVWLVGIDIFL